MAPVAHDVGRRRHFLAVLEDAIARHVGADIDVLAQRRQLGTAGTAHGEDRAWLRILQAEADEIVGPIRRHDSNVALHLARRKPARMPLMLAAADARPRGPRRQRFRPANPLIHDAMLPLKHRPSRHVSTAAEARTPGRSSGPGTVAPALEAHHLLARLDAPIAHE